MKNMKNISLVGLTLTILCAGVVLAQDDISQSTGIIGNGRLLGAKTYDGQTTVGVLGLDSSGNTLITGLSGKKVSLGTGDVSFTTSGGTLAIQEATAGAKCMGTATANGTTAVTVSTTCATTGSRIFLTRSSAPSGTAICWQTNIVNNTSFDLDCSGAETGTFDWFIIHEAS